MREVKLYWTLILSTQYFPLFFYEVGSDWSILNHTIKLWFRYTTKFKCHTNTVWYLLLFTQDSWMKPVAVCRWLIEVHICDLYENYRALCDLQYIISQYANGVEQQFDHNSVAEFVSHQAVFGADGNFHCGDVCDCFCLWCYLYAQNIIMHSSLLPLIFKVRYFLWNAVLKLRKRNISSELALRESGHSAGRSISYPEVILQSFWRHRCTRYSRQTPALTDRYITNFRNNEHCPLCCWRYGTLSTGADSCASAEGIIA